MCNLLPKPYFYLIHCGLINGRRHRARLDNISIYENAFVSTRLRIYSTVVIGHVLRNLHKQEISLQYQVYGLLVRSRNLIQSHIQSDCLLSENIDTVKNMRYLKNYLYYIKPYFYE